MNRALLIAIVAGAGCAGDVGASGDDVPPGDAGGCSVFLTFDPAMAIPGTEVRAVANASGAPGVLSYSWFVTFGGVDVPYSYAQPDQSAIAFVPAEPGPYNVMVMVGTASACPTAQTAYNVSAPGANVTQVRLRIYPPASVAAPPAERLVAVPGGGPLSLNTVPVEPGIEATGHVRMGATAVPAYLRFMPLGARDAYVEDFAGSDGAFRVRMLYQLHDVLVVPTVAGVAPRLVRDWMPGTSLIAVDAGTAISGVVRDPAGQPIANAQVQLALDGVPSTLATTSATGAFTVRATVPAGAPEVRVTVTPPAASGLPRIRGASTELSAAAAFTIAYSGSLVRRDLGGTVVRRGGAAQPNAPVKIVGTLAAVATITAGGSAPASGELRLATTTGANGAIPNGTLAPAAPLFAVTTIGGERAVDAIDLTTSVPASIDAPPPVEVVTVLRDAGAAALPGAILELVPDGPLALAGAPVIRATADASAMVTLRVPAGGLVDVRASDPRGRAAPLRVDDVPVASLASMYTLPPALRVTGTLVLSGSATPVGRAAVQILCTDCTGLERTRPLAEGAASSAGVFDVAVLDAGTSP